MNIFTLMGTILVDNTAANNSISATGQQTDGLATKLGTGLKNAAGIAVKGIAALGTAVAGAGAALFGMAMNSADTADRIDKLSAKIGISKSAFQEWDYIMAQNGMDVEKLQVGVKTLVNQMDSAAGGGKAAQEAFKKLGVTWDDGSGKLKSQEQMLQETITALAGMENGADRAKLASTLLGKAGVELAPMLNTGAEGIEELRDRAHELNLVMSDEAVNAGVVLGDTMDDVKKSFGAVMTRIGVEVMPVVQKLLDLILENMPAIQEVISPVFDFLSNFFSVAVDLIGNLVSSLKDTLVPAFQAIYDFIIANWPTIQSIFETVFGAIGAVLKPIVDNFSSLIPILVGVAAGFAAFQIITTVSSLFATLSGVVATVTAAITSAGGVTAALGVALGGISAPVIAVIAAIGALVAALVYLYNNNEDVRNALNQCWEAIKQLFSSAVEAIKGVINTFVEVFKAIWNKYGTDIQEIIQKVWDYIGQIFKTAIDLITDIFKVFSAAFQGDWSGMWEAVKELVSNLWNNITDLLKAWLDLLVVSIVNIGHAMMEAGKGIFNKLWEGIKNVWQSIKTWLETAKQDPVKTITGIGSSMFNAGKEIFNQLWKGIKNVWDSISTWVTDKVSWIKDKVMFWQKSESSMDKGKVDGSHAGGINNVPYDGYLAELHKGEAVLTASENNARNSEETTESSTQPIVINMYYPQVSSKQEIKTISRQLKDQITGGDRALGLIGG